MSTWRTNKVDLSFNILIYLRINHTNPDHHYMGVIGSGLVDSPLQLFAMVAKW